MQLTDSKEAQPKPGAFRPQVSHWALTVQAECLRVRWKASAWSTMANIGFYLPRERTWHKINDPKVKLWQALGDRGRARAEARSLPVNTGYQPTWCNVGLMSLVGYGPKHWSRHVCLIIAKTGGQGPVLYKSDKGVNDAPKGGPAEAEGISASSFHCAFVVWHLCQTVRWKSLREAKWLIFVSASHQTGLDKNSNDPRANYNED